MKKKFYSKFVTITTILVLTTSALLLSIPVANAVDVETYAYIMIAPNPVGVDQTALVTFRLANVPPIGQSWENMEVNIEKPDGTSETRGPYSSDPTGGSYFQFNPNMVGTYIFQLTFPGQTIGGDYYQPSTSSEVELTVQQDPVEAPVEDVPLPQDYWERPINAENKGWWQVTDNWLMQAYDKTSRSFTASTAFAPYTSAPDSAHVLWRKPIIFGGIAGGKFGDQSYYTGLAYEQFYLPFIVQGRIIYVDHGPTTTHPLGTRCLDLYTGEEIWFLNNTEIMFAQLYAYDSPNEHGILPYLWSSSGPTSNSTWKMYNAFNGRQLLTVTNITWGGMGGFRGGPTIFGPKGEILSYTLNSEDNWLSLWNSTKAIDRPGFIEVWSPPYGGVMDGSMGIQWNVSIPDVPGNPSISVVDKGYILAQWRDTSVFPYNYVDVCYNATTGEQLWVQNRSLYSAFFRRPLNIDDGIYVMHDEATVRHYAYNITTGEEKWVTDPLTSGWGIFTYQQHVAYGRLYTSGYDGYVRAYDAETGDLEWEYYMGNAAYETPYGTYPTYNGFTIADGKIYVASDEHSPDSVLWRGGKLHCINAETGEGVWNISGWLRNPAISDGILTALNSLDGQVYTFGKGPSQTTVSVQDDVIPNGESILIKGTVTDQSPAAKSTVASAKSPTTEGVPCIADADMRDWMEYLYMQKAKPEDIQGVAVKLSAEGPDGDTVDIGTVTSDESGLFKEMWTPPSEGEYTIIATFEGSNSYWPSHAETAIGVGPEAAETVSPTERPEWYESPPATVSPTEQPQWYEEPVTPTESPAWYEERTMPDYTLLFAGIIVAVVVAIVISVANLWMHIKRK